MNVFCVASFLLLFVTSTTTEAAYDLKKHSQAAFLTPHIQKGQILRAQELAETQPLMGYYRSYAGFLTVDKATQSNMFFWYIPPLLSDARSQEVPVILWLQGGPGVSSLFGAMFMNGPFRLGENLDLSFNNHTWANHAHMLYIDNPVGVGFSFTNSEHGYSRNETHVGRNLYLALLQFFQLFPNLQKNPLIITGESYAGKYLPALGITIHRNNPRADLKLNLQGIAIGNGWVDPINMLDFGDILYHSGLLDTRGRKQFNYIRDIVIEYILAGDIETAYPIYDQWILGDTTPYPTLYHNLTGLDTYYNYAQMGKSMDNDYVFHEFFNRQMNGLKLNVGKRMFHLHSKKVAKYLRDDILTSVVGWLAILMENYRVLVYSGQLDIKCAFALTENFLNKMEWNGAAAFKKAVRQYYMIDGELAGYVKTVGKFTQILIRNAGHMVSRDQAKWAERMIYTCLLYKNLLAVIYIEMVTIYATLGDDAIAHGINETEVELVITTHDLLPKFKNILNNTPRVKRLIYMEDQLKKTETSGFKEGIDILAYKNVVSRGKNATNIGENPPTKDDIAIIMYTSGSTGVPKGVLLTHNNMVATLTSFVDRVRIFPESDVFLGFLPLAHVFELLAESVCLLRGVSIGYSTPLTLLDTSSKIKNGCRGDAPVLKPTAMTAVPLIMDRISKGVNDKVSKQTPFKRALFKFAFEYKKKWMRHGFSCPLIDKLVFKTTRNMLGGRIRLLLSGGAPLSPDTHELVKICICNLVTQGYGLTETCSSATVMDTMDDSTGRVGPPTTMCQIRLENWEEGNYRVTDKPYPRGEILIGGDNVSPGYYKQPEKTREDFFSEDGKRWFRTGDVGEVQRDGNLKIIDRKKDLVKLQAGEYVSLGKVEAELKTCAIVENVCIFGDSNKDYTVALVVPSQPHLQEIADRLGINQEFEELCTNPVIEKAVLEILVAHGKKCKLEKFEIPAQVKLVSEVWSPDMGLVTAAFKLRRKDIQQRYQHEINRMYAS